MNESIRIQVISLALLILFAATVPGLAWSTSVNPQSACANWRMIGIKDPAQPVCPVPPAPGWSTSSLFNSSLGELGSYCLYEHQGIANPADVEELVQSGQLLRVDRDCAGVSEAADSLSAVLAPFYADRFRVNAGFTPLLTLPAQATRLAFLDSAVTRGPGGAPGKSDHGVALIDAARSWLCDSAGCAVEVVSQLALPIVDWSERNAADVEIDYGRGGYYGSLGQLALALSAELETWQAESPGKGLVLNLSIGWDGDYFGGPEPVSNMPVPARAVYHLLEVASCRGALIFAAAGNRGTGPDPGEGPVFPAAWERQTAPNAEKCKDILGTLVPDSPPEPLVYAVAGTSARRGLLSNYRKKSTPRRAAYGDHAVTAGHAPMTGSSVATMVVSASAALAWTHAPGLSRAALMSALDASGELLPFEAEVKMPGSGESIQMRLLSGCSVVNSVCAQTRACGPSFQALACPLAPTSGLTIDQATAPFTAQVFVDASRLSQIVTAPSHCYGVDQIRRDPNQNLPENLCPFSTFVGALDQPWVGPQPEDPPCPGMAANNGGAAGPSSASCENPPERIAQILLAVADDYPGGNLSHAVLKIGPVGFDLQDVLPTLEPNSTVIIGCLDASLFESDPSVTLYFMAMEHGSIANEVFVELD